MNIGDIETFYPMQAGGLESSSFCCGFTGKEESGLTGDDSVDDSQDDQESVEFEDTDATEVGGVSDADMPTFRQLVKAKKLELKAQYGKGHLDTKTAYKKVCAGGFNGTHQECKNIPYPCPTFQNPTKTCYKQICTNVPTWDANVNCNDVPYPEVAWIPGWRKQWRIFKRDGGLAQLKMKAQGLLTPQEQATQDAQQQVQQQMDQQLAAQQLAAKQLAASKALAMQRANILAQIQQRKDASSSRLAADEKAAKNKKMFIFGAIALVIIIAILLILMVIKSKSKQS